MRFLRQVLMQRHIACFALQADRFSLTRKDNLGREQLIVDHALVQQARSALLLIGVGKSVKIVK
jgi:hypothetical protein